MADSNKGTKVAGAYIEVSADSGPAEKTMAAFFNWLVKTGEASTELAGKLSDTFEKAEQLGKVGKSSAEKLASGYNSAKKTVTDVQKTVSKGKQTFESVASGMEASFGKANKTIIAGNAQMSSETQKNFKAIYKTTQGTYAEMTKDSKAFNSILVSSMKESVGNLKSSFSDLKEGFKTVGTAIIDLLKRPVDAVKAIPKSVQNSMKSVSGFISSGFDKAKQLALSQIQKVGDSLLSIPEKARQASNRVKDHFVTGFNSVVNSAATTVSKAGANLSNLPTKASQISSSFKRNFVQGIKDLPTNIKTTATRMKDSFSDGFKNVLQKGKDTFSKLGSTIKRDVNESTSQAILSIKGLSIAMIGIQAGLSIFRKVAGVVQDSIGGAIKRIDTLNNSTRAFENMGFTAKETENAMTALEKGIKGLPTPMDEAVSGLQMITAATQDVGKSQQIFNAVNDAILGFGGNTEMVNNAILQMSQAFSNGKIDAETWNSMMNSQMGPTLNAMAKQMGLTTGELKSGLSEGTISVETFQKALIDLDENGGGGLKSLQKIAKDSTDGIGTSMQNAATAAVRGVGNIIKAIDEEMKKAGNAGIADTIAKSGAKFEKALTDVAEKVPTIIQSLKDFYNTLEPFIPLISFLVAWLTTFIVTLQIQKLLGSISNGFSQWKEKTEGVTLAQKILNSTLLKNPFVLIVSLIITLVAAFIYLWKTNEDFRNAVIKIWDKIKKTFTDVATAVVEAWETVKEFFCGLWNGLKDSANDAVKSIKKGWSGVFNGIKGVWSKAVDGAKGVWSGTKSWFSNTWDSIKDGSKNIFSNVADGASSASEKTKSSWNGAKGWLSKTFDSIKSTALEKFLDFNSVVVKLGEPLLAGFKVTFRNMKNFFLTLWEELSNIAGSGIELLKNVILAPVLFISSLISGGWDEAAANMVAVWNNIVENARSIWDSLVTIVTEYITAIVYSAVSLWGGLKQSFSNIWNEIALKIQEVWTGIKLYFSMLWIEIKFSAILMWIEFKSYLAQTWIDIKLNISQAWEGIKQFFAETWENIKITAFAMWEGFKLFLSTTWTDLKLTVVNSLENIKQSMSNAWTSILQTVSSAWTSIKETFWNIVNGIVTSAQNAWESLKTGVSDAIKSVKKTIKSLKDVDLFEIGKNIIDGLIKGIGKKIKDVGKKIKEVAGTITDTIKDMLDIHSPSRVMVKIAEWVPKGVAVGIEKATPYVEKAVNFMTDIMQSAVEDSEPVGLSSDAITTESYGMPDASQMTVTAQQATQAGNQGLTEAAPELLQTALNTTNSLLAQFQSIDPLMVTEGANWLINFVAGWTSQVTITLTTITQFCNQALILLRSFYSALNLTGKTWLQNLLNGWNSLYQAFINRVNQLGNDAINNLRSKNGGFYSAGQFLIQQLINGINSMGGALTTTMNGVANKMVSGIGKGVNGVISGVNYVLKEVESNKSINSWAVPAYAQGTDGHPQDGPALINDQKGSKYQELVQNPDGSMFMTKARNSLVWLKKGAKVMNANLTDRYLKASNAITGSIPHYEDGIGEFDIEKLISDKSVFTKIVNDRIQYGEVAPEWQDLTKSSVKLMTDKAYEFVKKKAEELFMGSGSRAGFIRNVLAQEGKPYVWGAEGPDAFDCSGLIMWALKQVGINFPHYSGSQWNATEHISEKDAIPGDLIFFGANASRHVGMYTKKGQMFNAMNPRRGIGYSSYHASDLFGFGRVRELTDAAEGSSGSFGGDWAQAIRAAAKRMKVQVSASDVSTILSLIKHESGGNEKVKQQILDVNSYNGSGGAKGLLQFIQSTFDYYKVAGNGNIFSGYDQLLALFNNTNWRRDINPRGGWSPSGVPRYENGGLITQDGLYRAGEGNKPEMVIPLSKPRRAMELIMQALNYISSNGSGLIESASIGLNNIASNMALSAMDLIGFDTSAVRSNLGSNTSLDLSEVISLLQINNQLLTRIADKDSNIYIDEMKVSKKIAGPIAKEIVRKGL